MEAKANTQAEPFGAIQQIDAGLLNVGYVDLGRAMPRHDAAARLAL